MKHFYTLIITALAPCFFCACLAAHQKDVRTNTYYLHGDTIETDNYSMDFANSRMAALDSRKRFDQTYAFLSREDSTVKPEAKDEWMFKFSRYHSDKVYMLMETSGYGFNLIYANIGDSRIKIESGVHVGMDAQRLWKILGLPQVEREINHILLHSTLEKEYRFDMANGRIAHIQIRSSGLNSGDAWNPSPLIEFVSPELTLSDKGPKIFAHPRTKEMMSEVCYVNAAGDTIVPYSRGYRYVGWKEIGRLGLVKTAQSGLTWLAIDHEGKELFQVFGLYDFSSDFVSDGMFRIVEGNQDHGGLIGFADTLGVVRIRPQFRYATSFRFGRAKATMSGYLDRTNPENPEWKSDDWFFIDMQGNRVEDVEEEKATP